METLRTEINQLDRESLPAIERRLTAVEKDLRLALAPHGDAPKSADERLARGNPSSRALPVDTGIQVIATLERLLGELSEWDSQRRVIRELADLEQRATSRRRPRPTSLAGRRCGQRSRLRPYAAAASRFEKARHGLLQAVRIGFEKLQQNLTQLVRARPGGRRRWRAGSLADALAEAQQRQISAKMRDAGASVEQNQVGQAAEGQKQIAEDLAELLDTLANRREHELARLVKKLHEAEQELDSLAQQQEGTA